MDQRSALSVLLRRLRRRRLRQLLLEETAWAACGVLGAVVLMLLVGRQILDWPYLAAATGLGLGVAIFRTARRAPSPYEVARTADRHLELHDALSTACYFAPLKQIDPAAERMRQAQRAAAEEIARTVMPSAALPSTPGAAFYSLGAAGLLVAGLFGIRCGVMRSLDLQPPIVALAFDGFRGAPLSEKAARKKTPAQEIIDQQLKKMGMAPDAQALEDTEGKYDAGPARKAPEGNAVAEGDKSSAGEESGGNAIERPGGREPSPSAHQAAARGQNPPSEKDALLRKLQNAMANLLEKMKIKPPPGLGQQTASSQGVPQPGGREQRRAEKGAPGQGRQAGEENSSSADPQGQMQPGQGETAAQGRGSGQHGTERPSSQQARSGIGRQDGDKGIQEAAQLAAMGKISEILGRRAAEIKGEVMVEVRSGNQQLKTQYSQKQARHTDSGTEIHRDEIPLAYQEYVQQYFEQIRKSPAKAAF